VLAESGVDDQDRNSRSTALGAFQFIAPTFLSVARRHFAGQTAKLSPSEILRLRTNRAFARRAAEAYTKDFCLRRRGDPVGLSSLLTITALAEHAMILLGEQLEQKRNVGSLPEHLMSHSAS
jgi:hypothetical protein